MAEDLISTRVGNLHASFFLLFFPFERARTHVPPCRGRRFGRSSVMMMVRHAVAGARPMAEQWPTYNLTQDVLLSSIPL